MDPVVANIALEDENTLLREQIARLEAKDKEHEATKKELGKLKLKTFETQNRFNELTAKSVIEGSTLSDPEKKTAIECGRAKIADLKEKRAEFVKKNPQYGRNNVALNKYLQFGRDIEDQQAILHDICEPNPLKEPSVKEKQDLAALKRAMDECAAEYALRPNATTAKRRAESELLYKRSWRRCHGISKS
jgi:hypothetical protein